MPKSHNNSSALRETEPGFSVKVQLHFKLRGPHSQNLNSVFVGMKRLGVLPLPADGMLVYCGVAPSSFFAGNHLYTWGVGGGD